MSVRPDVNERALAIATAYRNKLNTRYDEFKASLPGGETDEIYTALQICDAVADWDRFGWFALSMNFDALPLIQCVWQSGLIDKTYKIDYIFPVNYNNMDRLGGLLYWAAVCLREALADLHSEGSFVLDIDTVDPSSQVLQVQQLFFPSITCTFTIR